MRAVPVLWVLGHTARSCHLCQGRGAARCAEPGSDPPVQALCGTLGGGGTDSQPHSLCSEDSSRRISHPVKGEVFILPGSDQPVLQQGVFWTYSLQPCALHTPAPPTWPPRPLCASAAPGDKWTARCPSQPVTTAGVRGCLEQQLVASLRVRRGGTPRRTCVPGAGGGKGPGQGWQRGLSAPVHNPRPRRPPGPSAPAAALSL